MAAKRRQLEPPSFGCRVPLVRGLLLSPRANRDGEIQDRRPRRALVSYLENATGDLFFSFCSLQLGAEVPLRCAEVERGGEGAPTGPAPGRTEVMFAQVRRVQMSRIVLELTCGRRRATRGWTQSQLICRI